MTIKDIAKAANVSPATVSKILNKKDAKISQETRTRVINIIKESGYVPYSKIRGRILSHNHTIGLIMPDLDSSFNRRFALAMQHLSRENGYSLMLSLSYGKSDNEHAILSNYIESFTDGIILFSGSKESFSALQDSGEQAVCVLSLDGFADTASFPQIYQDSSQIINDCTQLLISHNCSNIGLIIQPEYCSTYSDACISGYSEALREANLPLQQNFILKRDENFVENFRSMVDSGLDAVVCENTDIARLVYTISANDGLMIPEDISVISAQDSEDALLLSPPLSTVSIDIELLAQYAFNSIMSQLQDKAAPFTVFKAEHKINLRDSVRMRKSSSHKIVVAGYLNTDILLKCNNVPKCNQTQVASHMADLVGGKGANQAYGISMLGGNVYLLGCLGSDRRGHFIHEYLAQNGVKMDGVNLVKSQPSGVAYISLYDSGDSSVLIDPGANQFMHAEYIQHYKSLVKDSSFCLVQTDIPMDAVLELHKICKEFNIPMILNPAYVQNISTDILKDLYVLVVSTREAAVLCSQYESPEDKAKYFNSLGVKNVIVTDKSVGCIWSTENKIKYFPSYSYPHIDKTGTNDVFIACLVVLLTEGYTFEQAIFASNWAAAYSTAKLGVQKGFPDKAILESVAKDEIDIKFK